MKRIGCLLLSIILVVTMLMGCATKQNQPEEPASPDEVPAPTEITDTVGIPARLSASFHPQYTENKYNYELAGLVYEPLVRLTSDLTPEFCLLEQVIRDETGTILTLYLKKDKRFSDSSPLTSADVADTLNAVKNNAKNIYYGRMNQVKSIEILDEYTLTLTLFEPNGMFENLLEIPIVKAGSNPARPIGSGPYQIMESGGKTILSPNSYYQDGKEMLIKTVELIDTSNNDELLSSLYSGEVDLVYLSAADFGKIAVSGNYSRRQTVTSEMVYLGVANRGALSESSLRRAISSLLDRGKLLDDVMQKNGFVTLSPLRSGWKHFDSTAITTAKAEESLIELGYEKNANGVYAKGKNLLHLRVGVLESSFTKKMLAESVVAQLKKEGISAEIVLVSGNDLSGAVSSGRCDLYVGEVKLRPDMDLRALVGSGGRLNYGRYQNAELDEAMTALRTAVDEESKKAAASSLISILDREMPILPLYFNTGTLISRRALGFLTTPSAAEPYYGLHTAYGRGQEQ